MTRMRGANYLLGILQEDGYEVWGDGDSLHIRPSEGLSPVDLHIIGDLKPELLSLLRSLTSVPHRLNGGVNGPR